MNGPVAISSPLAEGYITRFAPNLIDATTGAVPPIHEVHLHHAVWLNALRGLTSYQPFFGTGEEKTTAVIPDGYGYTTHPYDQWVVNYMLHDLTTKAYEVMLTYDIDFIPSSSPYYAETKAVQPVWMDIVAHCDSSKATYPTYNTMNNGSDPLLPDPTAPSGESTMHTCRNNFQVNTGVPHQLVELVGTGGHVHQGGLRDELHAVTCNGTSVAGSPLLFNSQAIQTGSTSKFGSWNFAMTIAPTDWRYTFYAGDQISVDTFYDAGHPWYEAMGSMEAWAHPVAPGESVDQAPCELPRETTGSVSAPPSPPNPTPYFGGQTSLFDPTQVYAQNGPARSTIDIVAFDYQPGGLGQPPALVTPGETVTFENLDAAASIYHTVTSCGVFNVSDLTPTTDACNLDYGQAYPLATWPSTQGGFDSSQVGNKQGSGELGFGPPGFTAAANTLSYSLTIPRTATPGTVYTYYCRIHPGMRGSLKVAQ